MKKDFSWLASELVRQTKDSEDPDKPRLNLNLTPSQASHIINTLRNVTRFAPEAVANVLDLAVDRPHVMPPLGVCLPCEWVSCRDGDTVMVRLRTGQQVAVKLMDCCAPDKYTEEGRKAVHFLESLFERDGSLRVCFPLASERDTEKFVCILRSFAFESTDGAVYIGTENVSEVMVRHGHATMEEPAVAVKFAEDSYRPPRIVDDPED